MNSQRDIAVYNICRQFSDLKHSCAHKHNTLTKASVTEDWKVFTLKNKWKILNQIRMKIGLLMHGKHAQSTQLSPGKHATIAYAVYNRAIQPWCGYTHLLPTSSNQ